MRTLSKAFGSIGIALLFISASCLDSVGKSSLIAVAGVVVSLGIVVVSALIDSEAWDYEKFD